jgi:hypothetical protein
MPLKQIKGIGTIVWGAGSVLSGGIPAGAIIDSLQLTPKNGEAIEIEDNDGVCAVEVLLRDGFNGKASILYDAAKSWPVEGANCAVAMNWNGANANAIPFGESNCNMASYANGVVTYTCLITSVSPAYKKKGEKMVDFAITYRPNTAV